MPPNPGDIGGAIEDLPRIVRAEYAYGHDTVTQGKDAEQRNLLADGNLQVPVDEGGKNGSEKILRGGDDCRGDDIGALVKTRVCVAFGQLVEIYLVPEGADGPATQDGDKREGEGIESDEANGDSD